MEQHENKQNHHIFTTRHMHVYQHTYKSTHVNEIRYQ